MLQDLKFDHAYRSDRSNLVSDFYVPCLSQARSYSRAVGFFTSTSLAIAAQGLSELIKRDGKMRLVASPILERDDIEAIKSGYRKRDEVLSRCLVEGLRQIPDGLTSDRLGFLAWLIEEARLEIKIAIVSNKDSLGSYHEKIGLFQDDNSDMVAFTGSANESITGLVTNFESIHVFRSWHDADSARVKIIADDFEALWSNVTPSLMVFDFPEAARRELLKHRPKSVPTSEPGLEPTHFSRVANLGEPSIPAEIEIREYQRTAVERWFANEGRGVFQMATGTGKTITALALMSQLYKALAKRKERLAVAVVCPYKHLVRQWADEAVRFGVRPLTAMESKEAWFSKVAGAADAINNGYYPFALVITTNSTFQNDSFQEVISSFRTPVLLIADEVHNLGATKIREALPPHVRYRLGLSATPERWFDPAGTSQLFDYFGKVVFELGLREAISIGALTRYDYHVHTVELTPTEIDDYLELSSKIGQISAFDDEENPNEYLKQLLIRRARLVANAAGKLPALERVMGLYRNTAHNLFYCGDGQVEYRPDADTVRQMDAVVHLLGRRTGMAVNSYTADTYLDERHDLRLRFAKGELQGLVAIRCLDEGFDLPEIQRAFFLASSSNPKQFIQRRGRVLRRAPNKDIAEIHDFIVIPPRDSMPEATFNIERRLVKKELARVIEFARLADNGPQTMQELLPLREQYNLLDIGA